MESHCSDECGGGQLDLLTPFATIPDSSLRPSQTSITIDDVIYVVDTGKVKETQFDPEIGLSKLVETWVTRAAARQRRGRAGRTQPGMCYKLYTRNQEEKMARFPVPEILRVPLESISLTVKVMREEEDVKVSLQMFICEGI
jgi:ATP-dependent RNA helicase DHX57